MKAFIEGCMCGGLGYWAFTGGVWGIIGALSAFILMCTVGETLLEVYNELRTITFKGN